MKITVIADVLGKENNGTTITVSRLIDNMKKRGHDVKVVSPSKIDKPGYFTVDTIDFKIFNSYVKRNGVELAKPDKKLIEKVISDSDVVHILMPFALGCTAEKICIKNGVPFTTAFHAQPENLSCHVKMEKSKFVNNTIYKIFYKNFFKYAEYIHCPSAFIADELKKHGYKSDFRIISNGVDPVYMPLKAEKDDRFRDKYCIASTGRLSNEKRQSDIIKAIKLSKYQDRIQLFLAGDGPNKNKLLKKSKNLTNQPIISFYEKNELCDLLNKCDLYIQASYAEIECIAVLEAMTCGLVPLIADSRKSAARFFALTDYNRYKCGSPKELAKRIDFFIENQDTANALKQQYIDFSAQFQVEKCMDKMEQMFQDAINHKH